MSLSAAAQANAHDIPGRVRPFAKTQKPTPALVKLLLGRPLAPTQDEFNDLLEDLHVGDPHMDALVDWMHSYGMGPARRLFQQAATKGVHTISDCPEPLREFFATVDAEPAWLDWQALEEGICFVQSTGLASQLVLRDFALMGGYLLSGFNQALVMTGALSKGTRQRIAETGKWWMDCTEHGGLQRYGAGFATTLNVRLVHAMVRKQLLRREDWDYAQWAMPLNNVDMAATYLGFCVVLLEGLRALGIQATPSESRGVMMLWSYACWLMGVDEKWLRFSEREGLVLLYHTMMTQSQPDWTSRELGQSLSLEPLEGATGVLDKLYKQWQYQVHLSVSRFFLDKQQMRQLGLPDNVLPWYPLLTMAPRGLLHAAKRLRSSTWRQQQKRGRQQQLDSLKYLFGAEPTRIVDAEMAQAAAGR